jgi:hypothetical protein
VQASAAYYAPGGAYIALSAATLRFPGEAHRAVQIATRLGFLHSLDADWQANVGVQHIGYPFDPSWSGFSYDELSAGLAYADLVVASVSVLRHADDYAAASRTSTAWDVVGRLPLRRGVALAAGIGYHDLQRRWHYGYAYGHAGFGLRLGPATVDLAYTVTDATAKERFGRNAADRWTASLLWHF